MAKSLAVWTGDAKNQSFSRESCISCGRMLTNSYSSYYCCENCSDWHKNFVGPMLNKIKRSHSSREQIELHFNYWLLNSKEIVRRHEQLPENTWISPFKYVPLAKNKIKAGLKYLIGFMKERDITSFLDVGVKFRNIDSRVNIYFPFIIHESNFDSQMGLKVANDVLLLSAIFNCEIKNIRFSDSRYHHSDITFSDDEDIRFFTNIDLKNSNSFGNGVELHTVEDEGTIISFPLDNFDLDGKKFGYFRFRLILDGANKKALSTFYKPSDRFLLTTEETIEIIDFRINEVRNTPESINCFITEKVPLDAVHFFIIREVDSEYIMSDTSYSRCRFLEGDLWKKYLQTKQLKTIQTVPKMLIFHWKDKVKNTAEGMGIEATRLGHFSAFAKFRYPRYSLFIILRSITIALALSVLANKIYDYLVKSHII